MKSHNHYNIITTKLMQGLFVCLLLHSCYTSSNNLSGSNSPNEVILFCGNPGVGKSTLCNSIFGEAKFNSGLSLLTGLTTAEQTNLYQGKLYIDTPGLDDPTKRIQAAKEIEKGLKHNNNYKLIFVAKIDSGRIRNSDLVTINLVCETIKTPCEYGIIINQVGEQEMRFFEKLGIKDKQIIDFLSEPDPKTGIKILTKRPASVVILEEDKALKNEDNKYLQGNDGNRKKLLDFVNNLKANKIEGKDVDKIDTRNMDQIAKELEGKYKEKFDQAVQDAKDQGCKCVII